MLVCNLPLELQSIIRSRLYYHYRKQGKEAQANKVYSDCLHYSLKQVSIIIQLPIETRLYIEA